MVKCFPLSPFILRGGFYFLCGISCVKFITEISYWSHIKFCLYGRVHIIVDGDKSHIIFGKHNIRIHTDLQIVSAKTGHILDNDRSNLFVFNHLLHSAKIGAVKTRSGIPVIYKELQILEAVFSCILIQKCLLVDYTVTFTLTSVILR